MSQWFWWPAGTALCLHKRKLTLRKCQQLMKFSPSAARSSSFLENSRLSAVVHFCAEGKITFKIKHVDFIVPDNLWPVGWLADGFNTGRIANSHQKLNIEQSEPDRKIKTEHERVFYLSSTARLTCLSLSLVHLSLPFTAYEKLRLQTLLKPLYSSDLKSQQAGGGAGYMSWVVA